MITNLTFNIGQCGDKPDLEKIWNEMHDELRKIGCENSSWKYNNIYSYATLEIDNKIIGTVFHVPIFKDHIVYIAGAYVDPKWRNVGVYSQLWELFVDYCGKNNDLDVIQSGYHKDNIKSKSMQESQNRTIFGETDTHIRTRIYLRDGNIAHNDITRARLCQVVEDLNERLKFSTRLKTMLKYFIKNNLEKMKKVVDRILNRI